MSSSRPCLRNMPACLPRSGIAPSQLPRIGDAIFRVSAASTLGNAAANRATAIAAAGRERFMPPSWPGSSRPSTSFPAVTANKTWMPGPRPGMTPQCLVNSHHLPALEHIRRDDARPKREDVRVGAGHCYFQPMIVGRPEALDAREIFDGRIIRAAPQPHVGLVDPEVMAVAVHQNHRLAECERLLAERRLEFGEAARLLFRITREWWKLGIDIRLLKDHERAAVARTRVLEALAHPREIGARALGEFGIPFRRATEAVVAADDVQREKGDAAEIPAHVLAILVESSFAICALARERKGALAETLLAVEEQAAQLGEPLQRIAAGNALLRVAVGPFVVAGRVDQRIGGTAELPEPPRPQLVSAGAGARRSEIADMHDESERGAVELVEHIRHSRLLGGRVGEITDYTECKVARLLRRQRRWAEAADAQADDGGDAPRFVHWRPRGWTYGIVFTGLVSRPNTLAAVPPRILRRPVSLRNGRS